METPGRDPELEDDGAQAEDGERDSEAEADGESAGAPEAPTGP